MEPTSRNSLNNNNNNTQATENSNRHNVPPRSQLNETIDKMERLLSELKLSQDEASETEILHKFNKESQTLNLHCSRNSLQMQNDNNNSLDTDDTEENRKRKVSKLSTQSSDNMSPTWSGYTETLFANAKKEIEAENGNLAKAQQLLEGILEEYPNDYKTLCFYVVCLDKQELDFNTAVQLQKLLSLYPRDKWVLVTTGIIFSRLFEKTRLLLETIDKIQISTEVIEQLSSVKDFHGIGNILLTQNKLGLAYTCFSKALKQNPNDKTAKARLHEIERNLKEEDFSQIPCEEFDLGSYSITMPKRMVEAISSKDLCGMAKMLLEQEDYEEAERLFSSVLAEDPENKEAQEGRDKALEHLNENRSQEKER